MQMLNGRASYDVRIVAMDGRWVMQRQHYRLRSRLNYVRSKRKQGVFRVRATHCPHPGVRLSSRKNTTRATRLIPTWHINWI